MAKKTIKSDETLNEYIVKSLSKEQLSDLAIRLGAKVLKSATKEVLARSIETQITEHSSCLYRYPIGELQMLLKAATNETPLVIDTPFAVQTLWMDGLVVLVPTEGGFQLIVLSNIKDALKENLPAIISNPTLAQIHEFEKILCGIVSRVGIISVEELSNVFSNVSTAGISQEQILTIIDRQEICRYSIKLNTIGEKVYACYKSLDDEEFIKELIANDQFTYPEFNAADFTENIICPALDYKEAGPVAEFIISLGRSVHDAISTLNNIWEMVQYNYPPADIIKSVSETELKDLNNDQLRDLSERVIAFSNNVARWELKGNSAEAMFRQRGPQKPTVAPVKIGRNDACPCGSGKKFKKCCGRD